MLIVVCEPFNNKWWNGERQEVSASFVRELQSIFITENGEVGGNGGNDESYTKVTEILCIHGTNNRTIRLYMGINNKNGRGPLNVWNYGLMMNLNMDMQQICAKLGLKADLNVMAQNYWYDSRS